MFQKIRKQNPDHTAISEQPKERSKNTGWHLPDTADGPPHHSPDTSQQGRPGFTPIGNHQWPHQAKPSWLPGGQQTIRPSSYRDRTGTATHLLLGRPRLALQMLPGGAGSPCRGLWSQSTHGALLCAVQGVSDRLGRVQPCAAGLWGGHPDAPNPGQHSHTHLGRTGPQRLGPGSVRGDSPNTLLALECPVTTSSISF